MDPGGAVLHCSAHVRACARCLPPARDGEPIEFEPENAGSEETKQSPRKERRSRPSWFERGLGLRSCADGYTRLVQSAGDIEAARAITRQFEIQNSTPRSCPAQLIDAAGSL